MISIPSSTPASSIVNGGATKIQFQRTKVNMPNSLILAATLFITPIWSGVAFHGAIGSLVLRFFTSSMQPSKPVLRKSPMLGCFCASLATLSST